MPLHIIDLVAVKTVNIACPVYLRTACMIILRSHIARLRVDAVCNT